jgi:hypothetical protein
MLILYQYFLYIKSKSWLKKKHVKRGCCFILWDGGSMILDKSWRPKCCFLQLTSHPQLASRSGRQCAIKQLVAYCRNYICSWLAAPKTNSLIGAVPGLGKARHDTPANMPGRQARNMCLKGSHAPQRDLLHIIINLSWPIQLINMHKFVWCDANEGGRGVEIWCIWASVIFFLN